MICLLGDTQLSVCVLDCVLSKVFLHDKPRVRGRVAPDNTLQSPPHQRCVLANVVAAVCCCAGAHRSTLQCTGLKVSSVFMYMDVAEKAHAAWYECPSVCTHDATLIFSLNCPLVFQEVMEELKSMESDSDNDDTA